MTDKPQMQFGGGRVAESYDEVLVPIMFDPWAELLLETLPPEPDWDVLDLATGTGVVAGKLAARLGAGGSLTAADISADMLAVAEGRVKPAAGGTAVRFVETPAHPLSLDDASADAIYCQQGFQFFPDGDAAAAEMHRVARPGGRIAVSAWCALSECALFGAIAECLHRIGEDEAAATMGAPFDHMPRAKLEGHFASAGFEDVSVTRMERDLVFGRGVEETWEFLHATPLGPAMQELAEEKTDEFKALFTSETEQRTSGGITTTPMASLVLTAQR